MQLDVFGPNVKKGTSEMTDSIAELDVFEANGKTPNEPRREYCLYGMFVLYIQKCVSSGAAPSSVAGP